MDTHPKTAERPAIAADFTATTGLVSWYPQRDSNPCRHLERVVS